MVYGSWLIVHGPWLVVHGLYFLCHGFWPMAHGLWLMATKRAHSGRSSTWTLAALSLISRGVCALSHTPRAMSHETRAMIGHDLSNHQASSVVLKHYASSIELLTLSRSCLKKKGLNGSFFLFIGARLVVFMFFVFCSLFFQNKNGCPGKARQRWSRKTDRESSCHG